MGWAGFRDRRHSHEELESLATMGLAESPMGEVLIEEKACSAGKSTSLELMRDRNDNVVVGVLDREHRPDGCAPPVTR